MATELQEKPTGPAASIEERKLAQANVDEVFDEAPEALPQTTPADEVLENDPAAPTEDEPQAEPSGSNADLEQALNRLAEKIGKTAAPEKVEEPEKVLTPEEIDKILLKPTVTPEMLTSLGMNPEAAGQLAELLANAGKHGAAMARVESQVLEQKLKGLETVVSRLTQSQYEQAAAAQQNKFYEEYPALADEKYAEIISSVVKTIPADKLPKEAAARRKLLAESVETFVKKIDPGFSLAKVATPTTTKKTTTIPKTAVSSGTSRAGGGAGNSQNRPTPESEEPNRTKGTEVFD